MTIFSKSARMTKKLLIASVLLCFGQLSHASLVDRGGGLIYDTDLNVTWLQDANYALTSGFATSGTNGKMPWAEAMSWAENLSFYDTVRNVTWTDWRLPNVSPLNGTNWYWSTSIDGSSDSSYNIGQPGTVYAGSKASELTYMFYTNLGNEARCPSLTSWSACKDSLNTERDPALKTGPFQNLNGSMYWTNNNEGVPFPGDSIAVDFNGGQYGFQGGFHGIVAQNAWAVRSGDVGVAPIPEPETYAMLLAGVGLIGVIIRLRNRQENAL